jgi:hypothetical protein
MKPMIRSYKLAGGAGDGVAGLGGALAAGAVGFLSDFTLGFFSAGEGASSPASRSTNFSLPTPHTGHFSGGVSPVWIYLQTLHCHLFIFFPYDETIYFL